LRIRRQYDCDSLICERDPGNDEAYKEGEQKALTSSRSVHAASTRTVSIELRK
jgi:hypothetical protein